MESTLSMLQAVPLPGSMTSKAFTVAQVGRAAREEKVDKAAMVAPVLTTRLEEKADMEEPEGQAEEEEREDLQ